MARRRKSIMDIYSQEQRISDMVYDAFRNGNLTDSRREQLRKRLNKAWAAREQYADNIYTTKGNRKISNRLENMANNQEWNRYRDLTTQRAMRKYSQRTYMGLSNG